ncbi:hypothetical protein OE88DRAFT_1469963 [Heliocybe sulcata]|uniref:Uncharacterized protein n=1 Tax=Heliocybe sulcata TaxID=5364 RepID=A0A5C3N371_9AGAM|nr:hypothetical protein OE88DRAFT_1469963 [Heliocybe sulcata]
MAPSARFSAFKASHKETSKQSIELSVNISLPMPLMRGSGKSRQTPPTSSRTGLFRLRRKNTVSGKDKEIAAPAYKVRVPRRGHATPAKDEDEDGYFVINQKDHDGACLPTMPSSLSMCDFVLVEDEADFKLSESISQEYELVALDCDFDEDKVDVKSVASTATLAGSTSHRIVNLNSYASLTNLNSSVSIASLRAESIQIEETEDGTTYEIPIHIPAHFSMHAIAEEEEEPQPNTELLTSATSHVSLRSFSSSASSIRLPSGLLDNLVKMEMLIEEHSARKSERHDLPDIVVIAPEEEGGERIKLLPATAEGKRVELEMDLKRETFEMIERTISLNTHSCPPYYENPKFLTIPGWAYKRRQHQMERDYSAVQAQTMAIVFEPSCDSSSSHGSRKAGTMRVFVDKTKGRTGGRTMQIVGEN